MEKVYYDVNDVMKITGYKHTKCNEIINNLNVELEKYLKTKEKPFYAIKGRIPIWFFEMITGIERN